MTPSLDNTSERADVLICGAGVAGLVLATLLAASGRRVVVLEARSREKLAREGLFLTLAPNGMNALRAVSLLDGVARSGIDTKGIEFRNEHGRRLALVDQSDHAEKLGAPSVTITRSRLFELLLDAALRGGADVRFDEALQTLASDDETVTVETSTGARLQAPLLCACDGLRSMARQLAFPHFPQPHFTGLVSAGGLVNSNVEATGGVMRMTFGSDAFFGYIRALDGPVHWFNSFPSEDPHALHDGGGHGAARVRELHAQDPEDNIRILAGVTEIDRFYPIYDMPELPVWHSDRVVLVGDAAHAVGPHAGQGASMAIEDAVVLAACLGNDLSSLEEALRRYEALRRERVRKVVRATAHNGSQKKSSGLFVSAIRNLILRIAIPIGARMLRRIEAVRIDRAPLVPPS